VAAVAAKTIWKNQNKAVSVEPASPERKKPDVPKKSLPDSTPGTRPEPPNMRANPNAQYASPHMQKSMRFFMNTDPAFRARVEPASSKAKPACIKKTRIPAIMTQT
jgi:hypothetical protein